MLSLTRWNPFEEMDALHRELDRWFDRRAGRAAADTSWRWVPAAEITSTDDGWTVRMALPGIEPKNVDVEVDRRVLTIAGERGTKEVAGQRHLSELDYGRFERRFTLPEDVDTEKATAAFENGMLTLTLPVSEARKPRRIAISGEPTEPVGQPQVEAVAS